MLIDSHQHFWRYSAEEYPWMAPEWPIRRDFLPQDLMPLLRSAGIDGCVAVQARQTVEESRWLLELADQCSAILGVVGWVDLRSPLVGDQLAFLSMHPKFVGVRHVVQDEPDDAFVLGADFLRGLALLREFDLAYDLLVYPRQLPSAVELVRRFPEQSFVLDHMGKPGIKVGEISPWRERIFELAKCPNVFCKVSGMVTEADWTAWKPADFRPFLDVVFEAFGEERLMFGSDWPVCLLAAPYHCINAVSSDYFTGKCHGGRRGVFGGNAARFYGLQPPKVTV